MRHQAYISDVNHEPITCAVITIAFRSSITRTAYSMVAHVIAVISTHLNASPLVVSAIALVVGSLYIVLTGNSEVDLLPHP